MSPVGDFDAAVTDDLPDEDALDLAPARHDAEARDLDRVELDPGVPNVPALMLGRAELDLLRATIAAELTDAELALFGQVANRVGLDPFARQIYATKRGGKMVIQTGIDGYRLIARRTGRARGRLGPYFADRSGEWRVGPNAMPLPWLDEAPPAAALVGVRVADDDVPTWGVATWREYAITGTGDQMWKKMPSTMLAKCAEAQAIRAAFPAETSGVYTEEEMAQAGDVDTAPAWARPGAGATERLDPWTAKARDVVAELRRRGLDPSGREPELRQRLAEAMGADVIDVATETPASGAPEAQDSPDGPPTEEHRPETATGPTEAPRPCATCGTDTNLTGSVTVEPGPDGEERVVCPSCEPF